jgi:hypothetical protein
MHMAGGMHGGGGDARASCAYPLGTPLPTISVYYRKILTIFTLPLSFIQCIATGHSGLDLDQHCGGHTDSPDQSESNEGFCKFRRS